jgi:hypothetical protein
VVAAIEDDDGEGPVAGIPGVYRSDANFILGVMARTKWAPPDPPSDAQIISGLKAEVRRLRAKVDELERRLR